MSQYFGVIGNRDYIRYKGQRRPFWEFLDRQPDGWLTSLVYQRDDLPNGKRMIFDCGAWSYRDLDIPMIGKDLVTSEWLFEKYKERAKAGDFLIAADHMLIPGVDLDSRRIFNAQSAEKFLSLVQNTDYIPMVTVHGMDLTERIQMTHQYVEMGYKALALGGLAARASQKALILMMVREIRRAVPDVWLHVLGLSSPEYAAAWEEYGINSFDGSSHFKQAFTAGVFFTLNDEKMIKYRAARPGEKITAPLCKCRACSSLREEGVDTRSYGSNETNMGRAAHNMNMLMDAQRLAMTKTVHLVSCVGEKMDIPDNVAVPAEILYQSPWFRKASCYAKQHGRWYIISARYGLVAPDEEIYTYEQTLNEMPVNERREWAKKVADEFIRFNPGRLNVVILAGHKYREFLQPLLEQAGYRVSVPMESLGIGQQLEWLNRHTTKQLSLF